VTKNKENPAKIFKKNKKNEKKKDKSAWHIFSKR